MKFRVKVTVLMGVEGSFNNMYDKMKADLAIEADNGIQAFKEAENKAAELFPTGGRYTIRKIYLGEIFQVVEK